jgi:hypothetical protein
LSLRAQQDVLLRENRRSELARRLILHGVRTDIVMRLTDLSVGRLRTVRRRLGVTNQDRARGPTRWSLRALLKTPESQAEGGALVALCSIHDVPIVPNTPALPESASLDFVERLCDTYEAFCACYPEAKLELEHLILIRRSLSMDPRQAMAEVVKCRSCQCLLVQERFGKVQCWHCDPTPTRRIKLPRPRKERGHKQNS